MQGLQAAKTLSPMLAFEVPAGQEATAVPLQYLPCRWVEDRRSGDA